MKYLGWLSMMLLIACKSSIQDQVNDQVRACGSFRHEVLLIEDAQGSRYTASRRAALRVMASDGQDRSELLTTQACLDRPDGDAPLLITDTQEQTYAVVSQDQTTVRMIPWTSPRASWSCPSEGFFLRMGESLTVNVDWPFQGQGQKLLLELQPVGSEGGLEKIEPVEGRFPLTLADGNYLARLKVINPFGAESALGQTCPLALYSQQPLLKLDPNLSENLVLSEDQPPRLSTSPAVELFYCHAPPQGDPGCTLPEDWVKWNEWRLPAQGMDAFLHIRAVDRHGNETILGPIKASLDRQKPSIRLTWKNPLLNRPGHVEKLPFVRYTAKIELTDDASSGADLEERLQCRVQIQEQQDERIPASFVVCDDARCQGKTLSDWSDCSRDFSFRLDPKFWPLYSKDGKPSQLNAEVRVTDSTGKTASDSAMIILDPAQYPHFEAGTWQGQLLNEVADVKVMADGTLYVHQGQDILQGTFGSWKAVVRPGGKPVLKIFAASKRLAALVSGPLGHELMEYNPRDASWKLVLNEIVWESKYTSVLLREESPEAWLVGSTSGSILTKVLDGRATPLVCAAMDGETRAPSQAALVQDEAFLFYESYFVTFNLNTLDCSKKEFSAAADTVPGIEDRRFHKDAAGRIWAFDASQIAVFEKGAWQHFSRESLGLPAGEISGAARLSATNMVIFQKNAMHFVANHADGEALVLNPHSTYIKNPLAPGSRPVFANVQAVFPHAGAVMALVNGTLVRSKFENRQPITSEVFKQVRDIKMLQNRALLMTQTDGGVVEVSESSLSRQGRDWPITRVTSVLLAAGDPGTIFGYRADDASVKKYDWKQDSWHEDLNFASLALPAIEGPMMDRAGRLWFSWIKDGDPRSGNYYFDGKKLEQLQTCEPKPALQAVGYRCAEAFFESPTGDVYWRENSAPSAFKDLLLFDLYRWNAVEGLTRMSGPGQTLAGIFDIKGDGSRLAVSGVDHEGRSQIGVLEGERWHYLDPPDAGRFMAARIGWNRKGELFAFAQSSRVYLYKDGSWSSRKAGPWWAPSNSGSILNPLRAAAYYEDDILWWKEAEGSPMMLYDISAPARGQWWTDIR